ncbi:hypothetical protein DPMN_164751 [Dreissena polymorpha]|uniref:Uncharacterized protein n=1 Tax=Dreissena polymorpha TaxID=45954 RepID=A0A9D4EVS7_DREPO|nr:hypothetical protein DPMN_164751 [Dreissena polymorpha]
MVSVSSEIFANSGAARHYLSSVIGLVVIPDIPPPPLIFLFWCSCAYRDKWNCILGAVCKVSPQ